MTLTSDRWSAGQHFAYWISLALVATVFVGCIYFLGDLMLTMNKWTEGNFVSRAIVDAMDSGLTATFEFIAPRAKAALTWCFETGIATMLNLGFERRTAEMTTALVLMFVDLCFIAAIFYLAVIRKIRRRRAS